MSPDELDDTIRTEQIRGDKVGGDKVGRDKIVAQQYIAQMVVGEGEIQWAAINFSATLKRTSLLFVDHMRRFAGTGDQQTADQRYLPLRLQNSQIDEQVSGDPVGPGAERTRSHRSRWSGPWQERVNYPCRLIISGDPGSGKTTLMLYECRRLALGSLQAGDDGALPIYIPLRRYSDWSPSRLMHCAAEETGLGLREIKGLWQERRRPIDLFLDGVDEVPASELNAFISSVQVLEQSAPDNYHSIILSHRPDISLQGLTRRLGWPSLHLLPLDDGQLSSLLGRYEIGGLENYLDQGLRELLQTPDLLSALALSWRQTTTTEMPRSVGQIYQLYIDRHLFAGDRGSYDYQRVKRPVLALIAYTMVSHQRSNWHRDQNLEENILNHLQTLEEYYRRRRRVMPGDWSVQGLLDELAASPVMAVEERGEGQMVMTFSKNAYRDFYAAAHIAALENRDAFLFRDNRESWLPVLFILSGIAPDGQAIFDQVYHDQPDTAADLWLENRPIGLNAPQVLIRGLEEAEGRQVGLPGYDTGERLTKKLLLDLLDSGDPRTRLGAIGAFSQWGRAGIDPLLSAAADDLPLISAAARYALLHLGETVGPSGAERPVPPLFKPDNSFFSVGGCRMTVGPVTYISAPRSMHVRLTVNVGQWDVDLLSEPVTLELWSLPPHWLIPGWIERAGKVDWLDLLARLIMVSKAAFDVRSAAWGRRETKDLGDECDRRYHLFQEMAYFLARDLGLLQETGLTASDDPNREVSEAIYNRIRFLYSFNNRARFLPSSGAANIDEIDVNLNIASAEGENIFGGQVNGLNPQIFGNNPEDRFSDHHFVLDVGQANRCSIKGIVYEHLFEPGLLLPQAARIHSTITLGQAQSSRIAGVEISRLHSGRGGLLFDIALNIQSCFASQIVGLDVAQVEGSSMD